MPLTFNEDIIIWWVRLLRRIKPREWGEGVAQATTYFIRKKNNNLYRNCKHESFEEGGREQ